MGARLVDIGRMSATTSTRQAPLQLLRNYLRERKFGPNEQLPAERELAEMLNITRSRLRTSLAKLEKEGLIWRHVGQGTFMTPASGGDPQEAAQIAALETNPSEILEARISLEPQIAYLAAQRATGSDVDRLEKNLAESRAEPLWDKWSALDKEFHLAIAKASKNQLLLNILIQIQESQTLRNWGRLSDLPAAMARRDIIMQEHDSIFRAILARDAQAAADLMHRHLAEVRKALLGPLAPL
jgi:DNA-binding FadR family transcriptional regulator